MTVCTTLANGVRILSRPLPGRRSASLSFWLLNGARHEGIGQAGYAHLLEHLLFRGGGRFAHHFEALGGHINARTMRELTAFHGLVTADRVRLLARLFTSLLLEPRLDAEDLGMERPAVLREQYLAADTTWEQQEAEVLARVWGAHPLGQSILGDTGDVRDAGAVTLQAYLGEHLNGASLWVVAAGAVDHDDLVDACRALEQLPAGARAQAIPPIFTPRIQHEFLAGSMTDLVWVMPVPTLVDPAYWAFALAEQVTAGAPLSARLRCELRDRLGLVYAIDSRVELYTDCGLWWIRLQCESTRARTCRDAVEAVMAELIEHGPDREETIRTLAQLQSRWTLEEDDPECITERIAHEIAYLGRVTALNERLARLTVVGSDDVRAVLAAAWQQRASFEWGPGDAGEDGSSASPPLQSLPPITRRAG